MITITISTPLALQADELKDETNGVYLISCCIPHDTTETICSCVRKKRGRERLDLDAHMQQCHTISLGRDFSIVNFPSPSCRLCMLQAFALLWLEGEFEVWMGRQLLLQGDVPVSRLGRL